MSSREALLALADEVGPETPPRKRGRPRGARSAKQVDLDSAPFCSKRRPCGLCLKCQEDARWERIFTEKFADPLYYAERLPTFTSPLATF